MPTKANRLKLRPNSTCPVCHKEFYASKSQIEQSSDGIVYCSMKCVRSIKSIGGRKNLQSTKKCINCGNEFSVKKNRITRFNPQFCSKKCEGEHRHKEANERNKRNCDYCGRIYYRPPSTRGKYCSATCSFWAGLEKHRLAGPNGLESDFLNAFPQFSYVGDGNLWLRDQRGPMNPDFVLKGTNKLVELYGNFWHEGHNPDERIQRFRELGFDCLVIWESDFRNHFDTVEKLVRDFLSF